MKKVISILIPLIIIIFISCSTTNRNQDIVPENVPENKVQLPNPFIDFPIDQENPTPESIEKTIDEAEELIDFEVFTSDNLPADYKIQVIRIIKEDLAETIYTNGDKLIRLRVGDSNDDISGDYNYYPQTITKTINDLNITLKGNDNKFNNIYFIDGNLSYSIYSDLGLSLDDVEKIIDDK